MSLAPGTRLGAYEIVSLLGSGGMGEVYRARDTRLKREVAIKTLPERSVADPDSLARFQREGELLATLSHPNIAAIYGFEDSVSTRAIVMELVEGPSLAERIALGALPISEALTIAKQMAEALEAAHERGVIHRDLKPANVKVTPDGHVKVLDFGLAKLVSPPEGGRYVHDRSVVLQPDLTASPTLTMQGTVAGVLLGTAAYMSPEQARATPLDKRTDIWSFGCVLYEMLTGRRAFAGEEITDLLARIIERDPDFGALSDAVPPVIRKLLRRCLEKDRKRRLPDIGVARLEIEEALSPPDDAGATRAPAGATRLRQLRLAWGIAAGALVATAVMFALWAPWQPTLPRTLQRLSVELGTDVSLVTSTGAAAIVSPDGQTLAFVGNQRTGGPQQLFVRPLDQLEAVPLAGTARAADPVFSPDGRWIAFFADGKLKKISVSGGAAIILCDATNGRGAVWAEDDSIVFQPIAVPGDGRLMRVSATGGTPEPITTLADGEVTHRWPQLLPGGNAVVFTAHSTTTAGYEDANIVVQALPAGPRKILQRGGYYARYSRSGHLLYMHEGTLFAAPLDINSLELTAPPVPAVEGVATNASFGGAQFAVSDNGTLVYLRGELRPVDAVPIYWMDRTGTTTPLRNTSAEWSNPQFSPDGTLLAIDIEEGAQRSDVWIHDWARNTMSRLTFDPAGDQSQYGRPTAAESSSARSAPPNPSSISIGSAPTGQVKFNASPPAQTIS